eukprot:scaffold50242_cov64-Phaeocystis_antarctica.AAC.1
MAVKAVAFKRALWACQSKALERFREVKQRLILVRVGDIDRWIERSSDGPRAARQATSATRHDEQAGTLCRRCVAIRAVLKYRANSTNRGSHGSLGMGYLQSKSFVDLSLRTTTRALHS